MGLKEICYQQNTHCIYKDTNTLRVEDWKEIHLANNNDKKAGTAVQISDKIDYETKQNVSSFKDRFFNAIGANQT